LFKRNQNEGYKLNSVTKLLRPLFIHENEKCGSKQTIYFRNYICNEEYVYWNWITKSIL